MNSPAIDSRMHLRLPESTYPSFEHIRRTSSTKLHTAGLLKSLLITNALNALDQSLVLGIEPFMAMPQSAADDQFDMPPMQSPQLHHADSYADPLDLWASEESRESSWLDEGDSHIVARDSPAMDPYFEAEYAACVPSPLPEPKTTSISTPEKRRRDADEQDVSSRAKRRDSSCSPTHAVLNFFTAICL